MDNQSTIPQFRTPNELSKEMGLPIGGIRHWLFYRDTNGLASAVLKVGRKLLIDREAFTNWLLSHKTA